MKKAYKKLSKLLETIKKNFNTCQWTTCFHSSVCVLCLRLFIQKSSYRKSGLCWLKVSAVNPLLVHLGITAVLFFIYVNLYKYTVYFCVFFNILSWHFLQHTFFSVPVIPQWKEPWKKPRKPSTGMVFWRKEKCSPITSGYFIYVVF